MADKIHSDPPSAGKIDEGSCQDACHCFNVMSIATAEFIQGNAQCCRTTRLMLWCSACGAVKFATDPEQPEIK